MEFYLADRLGMMVARLRTEMSQAEFTRWGVYWSRVAQRRQLALREAGIDA